jgi:hypothetical protein
VRIRRSCLARLSDVVVGQQLCVSDWSASWRMTLARASRFLPAIFNITRHRNPKTARREPPSRRGANPKRTWRQPQADVAPNPNPCQLFPIAALCRFEPFQWLSRSRSNRGKFPGTQLRDGFSRLQQIESFESLSFPPQRRSTALSSTCPGICPGYLSQLSQEAFAPCRPLPASDKARTTVVLRVFLPPFASSPGEPREARAFVF